MSTISPNMGMTVPTVSETPGPTWAALLNTDLSLLDAHTHESGKGLPVPTAGLNINADLSIGGHNLTTARSLRLSSQGAVLATTTDLGCVYNVGGNLYWNNGGGTAVQITSGNQLAASSMGGITGMAGTTATATYSAGTGTFSWRQNTNQAAVMDAGPVTIRDTAASAPGITVQSPVGLAAAYSLTLPIAQPASKAFLTMTAAGVVEPDVPLAHGITRSMQAVVGQQVSASSGAFSTTSVTAVDVTNLSVTISTTGRPIMIALNSGGTNSYIRLQNSAATPVVAKTGYVIFDISGGATASVGVAVFTGPFGAAGETFEYPASSVSYLYVAAAGTYTIKAQAYVDLNTTSITINDIKLVVYEL